MITRYRKPFPSLSGILVFAPAEIRALRIQPSWILNDSGSVAFRSGESPNLSVMFGLASNESKRSVMLKLPRDQRDRNYRVRSPV